MRQVQDAAVWRDVVLDAPLVADPDDIDAIRAKPGSHPDDVLDVLGVRVKGGFDDATRRYRFYGKLAKVEGDAVTVVSTVDKETFWIGTVAQYHQMWCTD
jgi:hypothetical protein